MSENTKRRTFLEKIFGKDTGDEVDAAMRSLQESLDNAGVARKEKTETKVKGILEKLVESFKKPLGQLTDDENMVNELANQFLAQAMGAIAEIGNETAPEEEPIEEMAGEEEEEPEEELLALSKQVKDLAAESMEVYAEMKEFVPAFIQVAQTVEKLVPLVEKSKDMDTIEARLAKLERAMSATPRQAAKSNGFQNDALKQAIEKGTDGEHYELGVRVRKAE
jgi:DNA-binding ferritin-like protein